MSPGRTGRVAGGFVVLVWALAGACSRARSAPAPVADAAVPEPTVSCLVYRPCGCVRGCAGIGLRPSELQPGTLATIIAGTGCGHRARVSNGLSPEARRVPVLESAEECEQTCNGLSRLATIPDGICDGQCAPCR